MRYVQSKSRHFVEAYEASHAGEVAACYCRRSVCLTAVLVHKHEDYGRVWIFHMRKPVVFVEHIFTGQLPFMSAYQQHYHLLIVIVVTNGSS